MLVGKVAWGKKGAGVKGSGRAQVAGIVTQPGRPKGRNRVLQPSPVAALASERGFPPSRLVAPLTARDVTFLLTFSPWHCPACLPPLRTCRLSCSTCRARQLLLKPTPGRRCACWPLAMRSCGKAGRGCASCTAPAADQRRRCFLSTPTTAREPACQPSSPIGAAPLSVYLGPFFLWRFPLAHSSRRGCGRPLRA